MKKCPSKNKNSSSFQEMFNARHISLTIKSKYARSPCILEPKESSRLLEGKIRSLKPTNRTPEITGCKMKMKILFLRGKILSPGN